MSTQSKSQLAILLERYRLAVISHRDAVYSITYKINGSPAFGHIHADTIATYERTRIELLEIERELQDATLSRRSVR